MKRKLNSGMWGSKMLLMVCVLFICTAMQIGTADAFNQADMDNFRSQGRCFRCDLSGADLVYLNAPSVDLQLANLSGANFTGSNLTGAELGGVDLSGANLSGVNLTEAFFGSMANLSGVNFSGANLTKAFLSGANLSGVNFSGANLTKAFLDRANLVGATWTDGKTCNKASIGRCITDPIQPLPSPSKALARLSPAKSGSTADPLTPIISAPDLGNGSLTLATRYYIVYEAGTDKLVTVLESTNLSAPVLEDVLRYGKTYEYYVLDISTTDEVIAAAGPGYYTTPAKPEGVDDYGNPLITQGLKNTTLADNKLATLIIAGTGLPQAAKLTAIQGTGGAITDNNGMTLSAMNINDVHVVRSNGGQGKEIVMAASETSTLSTIKPLTATGYSMDVNGAMKSTADITVNASGINLPFGLLDFSVVLDPDSNSTNVVIVPPTPFAPDTKWYKVSNDGTLKEYPDFKVDSNGNGILTLWDNDDYDKNPAWGVIRDPGGPGTATGSGSGGGCFIATAAYGSYFHPFVKVLRMFRDTVLAPSSVGRSFIEWYYRVSPPIAEVIRNNGFMKAGVRIALLPLVGMSYLALSIGLVPAMLLLVILAAGVIVGIKKFNMHRRACL